jgi:FtsH-binding integral membrane protein
MKRALLWMFCCCLASSLSAQVVQIKSQDGKFVEVTNGTLFMLKGADNRNHPWQVAGFREEGILLKSKNENQVLLYDGTASFGLSPLSSSQYYAKKRGGIFMATFGGVLLGLGATAMIGATKVNDATSLIVLFGTGIIVGGSGTIIGLGSLGPLLKVKRARQQPIQPDGGSFYVY